MWLRSEKRSSRIAQPTHNKSSINLRKIIKNTPALKNLKQTTTAVTPNRRLSSGSVCTATSTAKTGKTTLRKNGSAKQLPTIKCNIKNQTGVKRLIKKSKSSTGKRHDKKKCASIAKTVAAGNHQKRVRLPRNSLQTISDVGKENRWQDQAQLSACLVDKRRGGRMRTTVNTEHHESPDPADVVQNNLAARIDTCSDFALANDSCDSCKPSSACSCSSSSIQTDDDVQSNGGLNVPKADCVNAIFVECDSTTDNDRTSAPSTSMLINPVGFLFLLLFFPNQIYLPLFYFVDCYRIK